MKLTKVFRLSRRGPLHRFDYLIIQKPGVLQTYPYPSLPFPTLSPLLYQLQPPNPSTVLPLLIELEWIFVVHHATLIPELRRWLGVPRHVLSSICERIISTKSSIPTRTTGSKATATNYPTRRLGLGQAPLHPCVKPPPLTHVPLGC